ISYRVHKGYGRSALSLSAGGQRMVRSDLGASGVMFTLDTESGFRDVVFITASWGLGEMVGQGAVNPDEFYVHKPMLRGGKFPVIRRSLGSKSQKMVFAERAQAGLSVKTVDVSEVDRSRFCLSDEDAIELARFALKIEEHYQHPMDIEWAKDGADGKIYILQARPETVKSRKSAEGQERFLLKQKSEVLASGRAIARKIGIPAVVGCGNATATLKDGEACTVSCAEGDTGNIYRGILEIEVSSRDYGEMPKCPVKITMNIGNPHLAFDFQALPNWGV